jgi:hypothetical protein
VLIVGAWHSLKTVRLRDGLALHAHLGRRAQAFGPSFSGVVSVLRPERLGSRAATDRFSLSITC